MRFIIPLIGAAALLAGGIATAAAAQSPHRASNDHDAVVRLASHRDHRSTTRTRTAQRKAGNRLGKYRARPYLKPMAGVRAVPR